MLNQLVQIPNQLLSHLDGLVQTDSPWLDRSTIKSVAGYEPQKRDTEQYAATGLLTLDGLT